MITITRCHDCCYSHYNGRNLACERFSMDVNPKGFCHAGAEKILGQNNEWKISILLDFYNEAEAFMEQINEIH